MEVQPSTDPMASSQHRDLSHTMNVTLPRTGAGSNYSFEVAARMASRMASTPFNDASSLKLSFIPPMSTIKPREVEQDKEEEMVMPMQQGSAAADVACSKREVVGASASRVIQAPVNESFEKTEFAVDHSAGHLR